VGVTAHHLAGACEAVGHIVTTIALHKNGVAAASAIVRALSDE